MSLNKVLLIGVVGKDPQVRYLEQGIAVVTLPIATSENYKDRLGVNKTQTEWHSVVFWRQLAELIEREVKKGTHVYVEGKLQTRSWEDQSGQKRYVTEIVAENLRLLGSRGNDYITQQTSPDPVKSPANKNAIDHVNDTTDSDNLPF